MGAEQASAISWPILQIKYALEKSPSSQLFWSHSLDKHSRKDSRLQTDGHATLPNCYHVNTGPAAISILPCGPET